MKKVLILLLSFILLVSVVSCGGKSKYENIMKQLKKSDYDKYEFTQATKELHLSDLKNSGLTFEGKVKNIAQFTKNDAPIEIDGFWVYEFELEKDAKTFYENYAKLSPKSRISGEVVVFGVADIVDDLDM